MTPRSKSIFNIFTLIGLLVSLLGSALMVTPVGAAALVVTKAADTNDGTCDGDCSLREAIILANANGAGSETITFAANYTITLGSQLPDVTTTIVINGNGPANTIIQASTCNPITLPDGCTPAAYRVFSVGGNNGNLTLDNLTVRHGKSTPQEGGGIYNDGALTVTNSVFSANSAYRGGGIFNTAGLAVTVTVTNSAFSNNSAYGGGGGILNNNGTLIVTNSAFSGNASNYGAGINNSSGSLTVTNSTFSSNTALYASGGILNSNGTLTVMNSTFSGNSAGDLGGGITNYNYSGTVTITNSAFSGNSAGDLGGGIYNHTDLGGTVAITNSTFSGNPAAYGGGIYNHVSALTVTNSTFSGNSASGSGGGIYNNDGGLAVTNSTFSGNSAAVVGGGIINYSTLTVTNSTFSGNYSVYGGGGIYNAAGLYLKNTILANSVGSGDCYNTSGDAIAANTNSLIETNGPSGNKCGTPAVTTDPSLGALANNGGATQTFAITSTSSAYNAGDNAICAAAPVSGLDQRGVTRPQSGICDIGAYELDTGVISSLRSAGANDGWVLESTETSGVGGTKNSTASTFNLGDNAANRQYRAILSFNTGGLPDNAVITKVTLKVKRQGVTGGGNPVSIFKGFFVDIKKGTFGTSALQLGDFKTAANKTIGPFSPALSSGWYYINLTTGKAQINKTGLTQIRLRFKLDDNNNLIANILKLYSGNAGAANRPQLIIEYYVP